MTLDTITAPAEWLMSCGSCGYEIPVTEQDWAAGGIVACPADDCDGGADIDHAKRHTD